jgi:hypothetical protein
VTQHQDTVIHKGNRLSLGANWSDSAYGLGDNTAIANGTLVGDVLVVVTVDLVRGWLWCRSGSGREGWVPVKTVEAGR